MAQNLAQRHIPMSHVEVNLLLELIEAQECLFSKSTNKTSNYLKDQAWSSITEEFNASVMSPPRSTTQLKLKWENLKKTARKKTAKIKLNSFETGSWNPDNTSFDQIVDRVSKLLDRSCNDIDGKSGGESDETSTMQEECETAISIKEETLSQQDILQVYLPQDDGHITPPPNIKRPNISKIPNNMAKKKRKIHDEFIRSKIEKNKAIVEYINKKKENLNREMAIQKLTEEKLKLEIRYLKSNEV